MLCLSLPALLQDWLPPPTGYQAAGDVPIMPNPSEQPQQTLNSDATAAHPLTASRQSDPSNNSNEDGPSSDFKHSPASKDALGLLPAVHALINQSSIEGRASSHSSGSQLAQLQSSPARKRKAGAGVGLKEGYEEAGGVGGGVAGAGSALQAAKRGHISSSSEMDGPAGLDALLAVTASDAKCALP
jgi:hypothetical protein